MSRRSLILPLLLLFAVVARADEIRLKDGSKIIGTIVDFENGAFKVETAYGFALVRRDSIAEIIPSDPGRSAAASTGSSASTSSSAPSVTPQRGASPAAMPMPQPAVARSSTPRVAPVPSPAAAVTAPASPRPSATATAPATPTAATPAPAEAAVAAPAPPPAPAAAPRGPLPIRESVQGNVYANDSYGFRIFRPPGWELIPEARNALPNAITALGTGDQTTLFVVGRESLRNSLDSHAAAAQRTMSQVYENYRPVSSGSRTVGGLPAVEWRFRGVADGRDWSVTALTIARGGDVFTLLGMTSADSDLIQIRENVIAKMMASLQFASAQ